MWAQFSNGIGQNNPTTSCRFLGIIYSLTYYSKLVHLTAESHTKNFELKKGMVYFKSSIK